MTLPEIAIRRPITTLMLLVSLVVLGIVAMFRLPLGFLPEVNRPYLFVHVPYPNATPEQVERTIVRPLEEGLGSVKGLQNMWSNCDREDGMVRLEFDWSRNMNLARVEVQEKVDRLKRDLPEDIGDVTVGSSWDSREADETILEGRLSSNRDLSESYDLLDRKVVKPLERVPGVALVRMDGVNPREVRVNLRVQDLESHAMDIREVTRMLRGTNFDQSLGKLREPSMSYTLRTVGTFGSLEEIQNLVLRGDGLRLRDVADVVYEEPPLEYGRHLDGEFAVGIIGQQGRERQHGGSLPPGAQARRGDGQGPGAGGGELPGLVRQGKEIQKTLRDLAMTGVFGALFAARCSSSSCGVSP